MATNPVRIDPIAGTGYGLAYPRVLPTRSGAAVASLAVGIASIVVSFVVGCLGLGGAEAGWGAAVSGAFAILAVFLAGGAIGLGVYALRQICRRGPDAMTGRGMAIAGISCGGSGIALTALAFAAALLATLGSGTG
jgi:hypothetical protein